MRWALLVFTLALLACDSNSLVGRDTGPRTSPRGDDASAVLDSGVFSDAVVFNDATLVDTGSRDTGGRDAAFFDAVVTDADPHDADPHDAASADVAVTDADPGDTALADAVAMDADPHDADPHDAFPTDAFSMDAAAMDTTVMDAAAMDAGPTMDAAAMDALIIDTGAVGQSGELAVTELFVGPGTEWIEIHNTTAQPIDLTGYTIETASNLVLGALTIRAGSDPSGSAGTPVMLAAGAFVIGVPNPANPADIPAGAFVFGGPAIHSADALADQGDALTLANNAGVVDRVDFTLLGVAPRQFPLVLGQSMQLGDGVAVAVMAQMNDDGDQWCTQVFRGATPGAVNLDCNALVISEVLYDYDSLTSGSDDGREMLEIAGPAGASLADVRAVSVQGGASSTGGVIGEVLLSAARMPLSGLYVIGDDDGTGATEVANANQIANLDFQNGPDAVQLVRGATLLDAFGYGNLPANLVDTQRNLPAFEGTPVRDLSPTTVLINYARSEDETDTNDNSADFVYDPTPTPGARNVATQLLVVSIAPDDAIATRSSTVVITGADFTDSMVVEIGGERAACELVAVDTLQCVVDYPMSGSGGAERVDVEVRTRAGHDQAVTRTGGFTWTTSVNGTDSGPECDFCNLQHPPTAMATAGMPAPPMFGRIFEQGVTDVTSGESTAITAEVGYGPAMSDPRASNAWRWFDAPFNIEYGNDDEYMGVLVVDAPGTYAYTFRFSLDGGLSWTYTDIDGAGSNPSLELTLASMGVMTVVP